MSFANVSLNATAVRTSDLTLAGRAGSGTLNGATPVVVAVPTIATTDCIVCTPIGANPASALPFVYAIVAGTSFSVASVAGDTRAFNWCIISTA